MYGSTSLVGHGCSWTVEWVHQLALGTLDGVSHCGGPSWRSVWEKGWFCHAAPRSSSMKSTFERPLLDTQSTSSATAAEGSSFFAVPQPLLRDPQNFVRAQHCGQHLAICARRAPTCTRCAKTHGKNCTADPTPFAGQCIINIIPPARPNRQM